MSLRDSDKVTFLDVAARFSEEEWKLLQEWQKELYNSVMKEIQQALVYLGPLIATSVFSLKPKERECLLASDCMESHKKGVERKTESHVVLRKSEGNHQYDNGTENEEIQTADVVSFIIKEEGEMHSIDHVDVQRGEQSNSATGFLFHNVKAEAPATNYVNLEREQSPIALVSLIPGHDGSNTPVSLITVIDDDEPSTIDISDCRRKEFNSNPEGREVILYQTLRGICKPITLQAWKILQGLKSDQRTLTRKWEDGDFATYAEKTNAPKAPCGKVRKSLRESNSKSQIWSVSNQTIVGEKGSKSEEIFPNAVYPSSVHQGSAKSGISNQHNTYERPIWNAQSVSGQAAFTALQRTRTETFLRERYFQCTECSKRFTQKVHLVRHQRTHSGERPYCCTQCGKSFIQKHHLLGHQRAHSGEKPFQCTHCMKSFSWKECLYRHQRTHTAKQNLPAI